MNSRLRSLLSVLLRTFPVMGWLVNRVRFPGLHCAPSVEINAGETMTWGSGVRLGQGTRIELALGSCLKISDGVTFCRNVHVVCSSGTDLFIGKATSVQDGCRLYGSVSIGSGCLFAPNIFVSSGGHYFDVAPHLPILVQERRFSLPPAPVSIGDDCWLGINAVVMPGITIGRGCIVGANSVVTRDLPPYSIAVGSPARVIRQRFSFSPKARIEAGREIDWPYFYNGFELPTPDQDAGGGMVVAEGSFSLALRKPGAKMLRVCAAGKGALSCEGNIRPVGDSPCVLEFEIAPTGDDYLFNLRSSSQCRIYWAELG